MRSTPKQSIVAHAKSPSSNPAEETLSGRVKRISPSQNHQQQHQQQNRDERTPRELWRPTRHAPLVPPELHDALTKARQPEDTFSGSYQRLIFSSDNASKSTEKHNTTEMEDAETIMASALAEPTTFCDSLDKRSQLKDGHASTEKREKQIGLDLGMTGSDFNATLSGTGRRVIASSHSFFNGSGTAGTFDGTGSFRSFLGHPVGDDGTGEQNLNNTLGRSDRAAMLMGEEEDATVGLPAARASGPSSTAHVSKEGFLPHAIGVSPLKMQRKKASRRRARLAPGLHSPRQQPGTLPPRRPSFPVSANARNAAAATPVPIASPTDITAMPSFINGVIPGPNNTLGSLQELKAALQNSQNITSLFSPTDERLNERKDEECSWQWPSAHPLHPQGSQQQRHSAVKIKSSIVLPDNNNNNGVSSVASARTQAALSRLYQSSPRLVATAAGGAGSLAGGMQDGKQQGNSLQNLPPTASLRSEQLTDENLMRRYGPLQAISLRHHDMFSCVSRISVCTSASSFLRDKSESDEGYYDGETGKQGGHNGRNAYGGKYVSTYQDHLNTPASVLRELEQKVARAAAEEKRQYEQQEQRRTFLPKLTSPRSVVQWQGKTKVKSGRNERAANNRAVYPSSKSIVAGAIRDTHTLLQKRMDNRPQNARLFNYIRQWCDRTVLISRTVVTPANPASVMGAGSPNAGALKRSKSGLWSNFALDFGIFDENWRGNGGGKGANYGATELAFEEDPRIAHDELMVHINAEEEEVRTQNLLNRRREDHQKKVKRFAHDGALSGPSSPRGVLTSVDGGCADSPHRNGGGAAGIGVAAGVHYKLKALHIGAHRRLCSGLDPWDVRRDELIIEDVRGRLMVGTAEAFLQDGALLSTFPARSDSPAIGVSMSGVDGIANSNNNNNNSGTSRNPGVSLSQDTFTKIEKELLEFVVFAVFGNVEDPVRINNCLDACAKQHKEAKEHLQKRQSSSYLLDEGVAVDPLSAPGLPQSKESVTFPDSGEPASTPALVAKYYLEKPYDSSDLFMLRSLNTSLAALPVTRDELGGEARRVQEQQVQPLQNQKEYPEKQSNDATSTRESFSLRRPNAMVQMPSGSSLSTATHARQNSVSSAEPASVTTQGDHISFPALLPTRSTVPAPTVSTANLTRSQQQQQSRPDLVANSISIAASALSSFARPPDTIAALPLRLTFHAFHTTSQPHPHPAQKDAAVHHSDGGAARKRGSANMGVAESGSSGEKPNAPVATWTTRVDAVELVSSIPVSVIRALVDRGSHNGVGAVGTSFYLAGIPQWCKSVCKRVLMNIAASTAPSLVSLQLHSTSLSAATSRFSFSGNGLATAAALPSSSQDCAVANAKVLMTPVTTQGPITTTVDGAQWDYQLAGFSIDLVAAITQSCWRVRMLKEIANAEVTSARQVEASGGNSPTRSRVAPSASHMRSSKVEGDDKKCSVSGSGFNPYLAPPPPAEHAGASSTRSAAGSPLDAKGGSVPVAVAASAPSAEGGGPAAVPDSLDDPKLTRLSSSTMAQNNDPAVSFMPTVPSALTMYGRIPYAPPERSRYPLDMQNLYIMASLASEESDATFVLRLRKLRTLYKEIVTAALAAAVVPASRGASPGNNATESAVNGTSSHRYSAGRDRTGSATASSDSDTTPFGSRRSSLQASSRCSSLQGSSRRSSLGTVPAFSGKRRLNTSKTELCAANSGVSHGLLLGTSASHVSSAKKLSLQHAASGDDAGNAAATLDRWAHLKRVLDLEAEYAHTLCAVCQNENAIFRFNEHVSFYNAHQEAERRIWAPFYRSGLRISYLMCKYLYHHGLERLPEHYVALLHPVALFLGCIGGHRELRMKVPELLIEVVERGKRARLTVDALAWETEGKELLEEAAQAARECGNASDVVTCLATEADVLNVPLTAVHLPQTLFVDISPISELLDRAAAR